MELIIISEMEERIKMMQTRLELKLEEGRNVNQELGRAREEKLLVEQENTRLRHRLDLTFHKLENRKKKSLSKHYAISYFW